MPPGTPLSAPIFSLGCAVWAYKDWVGDLFPVGSRPAQFLQLYSRRFTTVEGNTTFYSIPSPETLDRWVAETPPGFQFCLKLPRTLTHHGLLQPMIPGSLDFLQQMQRLGDRLGPIFAQLPPNYGPECLGDLAAFLQAWPYRSAELAIEVRHPAWFQAPHHEKLTALLQELGVGRVLLDTRPIYDCPGDPQLRSERRKPKLPLIPHTTVPFSLIRYISHPDPALNQTYLEGWTRQVGQWLGQGIRIYFFVHCPTEARSPANAQTFQALLEAQEIPVPPLPWNQLEQPPAQLDLFS